MKYINEYNDYEKNLFNKAGKIIGVDVNKFIETIKKHFKNDIIEVSPLGYYNAILFKNNKSITFHYLLESKTVSNLSFTQHNLSMNGGTLKEVTLFIKKGLNIEYIDFYDTIDLFMGNIIDVLSSESHKKIPPHNKNISSNKEGEMYYYYTFKGLTLQCFKNKVGIYLNGEKVKYLDDLIDTLKKTIY